MKWKSALLSFFKWTLTLSYLIASLSFVSNRGQQVVCSHIEVQITDSLTNAFTTKKDILKNIEKHHSNLIGIPLKMINTHEIEQQILSMHAVKKVDAFKTSDGRLTLNVEQRKPIVRVINKHGESYYIDIDGKVMPLSSKYTSHVLLINGNIIEPFEITSNTSINDWIGKNVTEHTPLICKLYLLAQFIYNDELWRAQIAQVYVDNPNNIELIPRVGPHTIILGSADNFEHKLAKLRIFYQTALPEEGWNKYKQINLKYSNQIVCTKR